MTAPSAASRSARTPIPPEVPGPLRRQAEARLYRGRDAYARPLPARRAPGAAPGRPRCGGERRSRALLAADARALLDAMVADAGPAAARARPRPHRRGGAGAAPPRGAPAAQPPEPAQPATRKRTSRPPPGSCWTGRAPRATRSGRVRPSWTLHLASGRALHPGRRWTPTRDVTRSTSSALRLDPATGRWPRTRPGCRDRDAARPGALGRPRGRAAGRTGGLPVSALRVLPPVFYGEHDVSSSP